MKVHAALTCLALSISLACNAMAQTPPTPPSEEDELALLYGDKTSISLATGSAQPLARAPAVASVITARDIAAMGATDLDQVLESVAGLHVQTFSAPLNPIYAFRGIATGYNTQVLVLVNGLPITSVFIGNRGQAWGGMPLENVARIEVIRGPGSALYGADAFSGVINVITKTANDIKGTEFGVRAGSFANRDAYVQVGGTVGPVQAALFLRSGSSDMQNSVIQKDVQSLLDGLFGTHASLAPGRINAQRDAHDARVDLSLDAWRLRFGAQKRTMGIGLGLADALDATGRVPETRLYSDLSYTKDNYISGWDLSAVLGAYQLDNPAASIGYLLFPAGAFGGAYPQGVTGNPGHAERHHHLSISAAYTELADHRLRVGTGYRHEDMYETVEFKNFNFVAIPGVGPALLPLGHLVDARTDPNLLYLQPHQRNVRYLFVQDEWKVAKDWTVTAGVRHDRYSDFGGTTNPRLALVWDVNYNLIVKALHGRAFRAPNFTEQYSRNNPVNVGNPSIRPETMQMNELAMSWQPKGNLQFDLSLYRYRMSHIILATANADPSTGKTYQNTGDQTGRGVELEAGWDATRTVRFAGHISLQRSTDEASGKDAGLAPHRRLFGRADWRIGGGWQAGAIVNHVAGRQREPGDLRPAIADYTSTDLTLRHDAGSWSVRTTLLNAFDKDRREPTLSPGNVPFDIPLPGRALNVELGLRF